MVFNTLQTKLKNKLNEADMIQSMSRVSRCIDNGPMEAFWGILKSEMYYLKKFYFYDELKVAIIDYYNNHRYQKRLKSMTLLEYRKYSLKSVT